MSFSPNGLNLDQWNKIYAKTHPKGKATPMNARQAFWNSSYGRLLRKVLSGKGVNSQS